MKTCFGFGFGFGSNKIVPENSNLEVSASLGMTGTQYPTQGRISVPLVNPVAPAPVDLIGGQSNPQTLANELMPLDPRSQASADLNGTISREAARNDEILLKDLLGSLFRKKPHYSKDAEKLKTYYFGYFQEKGMPTPSDIISHLKNNNRQGTETALRTILNDYQTTLPLVEGVALIPVKKKIVTKLSKWLIEEFNVHQSQLSQPRTATVRAEARRAAQEVSASLGTTGQYPTQGRISVPLVSISTDDSAADIELTFITDVGDSSPPAKDPDIQDSASHANHPMTDPEASNPSNADAPDTYRGPTRRNVLKKIGGSAAAGVAGGGIIGGFPGAFTGGVVGTLCGAISSAVESNWDGPRITPSLGECVLNGIPPFNV